MWGTLVTLGLGIVVGIAAVWFLVIPDKTQKVLGSANEQILMYGDQLATRDAKITQLESELENSQVSSNDTQQQSEQVAKRVSDYDKLVQAVNAFNGTDYVLAASLLTEVDSSSLSEEAAPLYQTLRQNLSEYIQQDQPEDQEQAEGQDPAGGVLEDTGLGDMTGEGLY